jgi:phage-related protein
LTHGLLKKSQKTPEREIDKTESYRKDSLSRRKIK